MHAFIISIIIYVLIIDNDDSDDGDDIICIMFTYMTIMYVVHQHNIYDALHATKIYPLNNNYISAIHPPLLCVGLMLAIMCLDM